jgi:ABC-type sugar transport system ATPase subunit
MNHVPHSDLRGDSSPVPTEGVHLRHISLRFDKDSPPAVDDVTLDVAAGEFLVIVGESGAGKSTLLRIIAGLESPDSGDIYIGPHLVNGVPAGQRGVQMIFQTLALWPHLKVLDQRDYSNVSFPLKIRRWSPAAIAERVTRVAQRVGLRETLYNRKPRELSGGESQRVALARAMVTEATVYVMDEPLNSLDPISRTKMRSEVRRLHQEIGATTIFVTHDIREAAALADRVVVMREGRVVQTGTMRDLRASPAQHYVAELLNS